MGERLCFVDLSALGDLAKKLIRKGSHALNPVWLNHRYFICSIKQGVIWIFWVFLKSIGHLWLWFFGFRTNGGTQKESLPCCQNLRRTEQSWLTLDQPGSSQMGTPLEQLTSPCRSWEADSVKYPSPPRLFFAVRVEHEVEWPN
jgi:hypothetical protein